MRREEEKEQSAPRSLCVKRTPGCREGTQDRFKAQTVPSARQLQTSSPNFSFLFLSVPREYYHHTFGTFVTFCPPPSSQMGAANREREASRKEGGAPHTLMTESGRGIALKHLPVAPTTYC